MKKIKLIIMINQKNNFHKTLYKWIKTKMIKIN